MDEKELLYQERAEKRALEHRMKVYTCGDCQHCKRPEDEGFYEYRGIGYCTESEEFVNVHVLAKDMDCEYILPTAEAEVREARS